MKNTPDPNFLKNFQDGKLVQVGTDSSGNPLYQNLEAASDSLTVFSENHARSRGSVGAGTGKSNVSAAFLELRAGAGEQN